MLISWAMTNLEENRGYVLDTIVRYASRRDDVDRRVRRQVAALALRTRRALEDRAATVATEAGWLARARIAHVGWRRFDSTQRRW